MTGNSFGSRATLRVGDSSYEIHRLDAMAAGDLPFSLKILLENLLRTEDGVNVTAHHVTALAEWDAAAEPSTEIQFSPARVRWSTWPPCARRCGTSAAIRAGSTRWSRPSW